VCSNNSCGKDFPHKYEADDNRITPSEKIVIGTEWQNITAGIFFPGLKRKQFYFFESAISVDSWIIYLTLNRC
jgi:hypothetical protein